MQTKIAQIAAAASVVEASFSGHGGYGSESLKNV